MSIDSRTPVHLNDIPTTIFNTLHCFPSWTCYTCSCSLLFANGRTDTLRCFSNHREPRFVLSSERINLKLCNVALFIDFRTTDWFIFALRHYYLFFSSFFHHTNNLYYCRSLCQRRPSTPHFYMSVMLLCILNGYTSGVSTFTSFLRSSIMYCNNWNFDLLQLSLAS